MFQPNGCAKAVGWMVFSTGSGTTPSGACPTTWNPQPSTTCVQAAFINGRDTAAYNVFQTTPPILSVADGNTYTLTMISLFNAITYKSVIDKSGRWLLTGTDSTSSTVTPGGVTPYLNQAVHMDMTDTAISANRLAPNWPSARYTFSTGFGHAAHAASHAWESASSSSR